MNRYQFAVLTIALLCAHLFAADYYVTTARDHGPGSLRQAMIDADANPDICTIYFALPKSDSAYSPVTGVWTIRPQTALPELNGERTSISGSSQTVLIGDTNPLGPEVEISGYNRTMDGFVISGPNNTVSGLIINGFRTAVIITSAKAIGNSVNACYIGTSYDGTYAIANESGFYVRNGARGTIIGGPGAIYRNIISGNKYDGIVIYSPGTDSTQIMANYIGTTATGTAALGNEMGGIYIFDGPKNTVIGGLTAEVGNVISGSNTLGNIYMGNGITLEDCNATSIYGNCIGTDATGRFPIGNASSGIGIFHSAENKIGLPIGEAANIISGNGIYGIFLRFPQSVHNNISANYIGTNPIHSSGLGNNPSQSDWGAGINLDYGANHNIMANNEITANGPYGVIIRHDSTTSNSFTSNLIYGHTIQGIHNVDGGNKALPPPVLTQASATHVVGTAGPGDYIEIFCDQKDEGEQFIGFAFASPTGEFNWDGEVPGPFVTATATDAEMNTSEFSAAIGLSTGIEDLKTPVQFGLAQNYPNPFNASTTVLFSICQTAHVRVSVHNDLGQEIAVLAEGYRPAGQFTASFQAEGLPSGIYYIRLIAGSRRAQIKALLLK